MEKETFKKYIQNLEDYVFIEDKIVTCVWLCQTLKVHSNTAKQLLHAFLQEEGVKEKVSVTYFIGGELKDGGIKLELVKDEEREEVVPLYSKLTSDHVFSIQKSAESLSSVDIYNSYPHFNINSEDQKLRAVKPAKEIPKREIKHTVVETKKEIPRAPVNENKAAEKTGSTKRESNDVEEPPAKLKKTSPEKNANNKVNKKGGIADLFNKQSEKNKSEPPTTNDGKKEEKKKSAGIGGFFQKQPPKPKESTNEPMEVHCDATPIKETNNKIEENDKIVTEKNVEKSIKNGKEDPTSKEKKSRGKENRKKRKKRDEKEDDSRKKRKRIASVFSSDSESSANEASDYEMESNHLPPCAPELKDEEEEDIIPPTPGRKRVRKQIDKVFKDEDGFIMTKKEYVYESCTDDEGVEEPKKTMDSDTKTETSSKTSNIDDSTKTSDIQNNKKISNNKKSPVKKKSPKANNKQPSIMNFFKKK